MIVMLNFRKLKHEFSHTILQQGRELFATEMVESVEITHLTAQIIRFSCRVSGNFDNSYESEVEVDRLESEVVDSDCDCPYSFDCQHLAAVLFFLEKHLDECIAAFSKKEEVFFSSDEEEQEELRETFEKATTKVTQRQDQVYQHEVLDEYCHAYSILSSSPFFTPTKRLHEDAAELAIVCTDFSVETSTVDFHIALRLPYRSKPLNISSIKDFCDGIRYRTPLEIGRKKYFFTKNSFPIDTHKILMHMIAHARFYEGEEEKNKRTAKISFDDFGQLMLHASSIITQDMSSQELPCLYKETIETPLFLSPSRAHISFNMECLETPTPKIFLTPHIVLNEKDLINPDALLLFEGSYPCILHNMEMYRFEKNITRAHLHDLSTVKELTIPHELFGSFIENALPEMMHYADIRNLHTVEKYVTLPFVEELEASCDIQYLNGELEAELYFIYDTIKIPAVPQQASFGDIAKFSTDEGVLARNIYEERTILKDLFSDFIFNEEQGSFTTKAEKKIVEFMTDIIPQNKHRITFNCPQNLLDQFIYDDTAFTLSLVESDHIGVYTAKLDVDGSLAGTNLNLLWECLTTKKPFIELEKRKKLERKKKQGNSLPKILVLDLAKLAPLVQLFDDLSISVVNNQEVELPLWTLAHLTPIQLNNVDIDFSLSSKLEELQRQLMGTQPFKTSPIPVDIKASLREYQEEGVFWLERLRHMHLNGILADDMGLGKTLQAITAITQHKKSHEKSNSLVVCPTSLLYNWKAEFAKFNKDIKTIIIDGPPSRRKKLLATTSLYDVVITSYTLLQKDIETYRKTCFSYAILDEAHHIKNRDTLNAKSSKLINAEHRLILTGTPIENSLDELWSLFDFLMPGLLSTYNRFTEKYVKAPREELKTNIDVLRNKISPFILRRMKCDVLKDLPPVSEILYHCHLSEVQKALYKSYADTAREELTSLVKKEGFEKVHIHVLATLTRLKQICCHPAIFAKEKAEEGDSAKYEMLMELLQSLIEGQHKTVIFSQYTKMLNILRQDLEKLGVKFAYLDGTTKNRLDVVNTFNEDPSLSVFLVSLKAGGSGLNIIGADTVIHYDMWWNPAVENQATDRVHRIGQENPVSAYKLVTLGTIEEKILELQNRKKELIKNVIYNDDDVISKLTWDEVLELLQT
jgi:SNF2 family DNA or RNA helicase